MCKPYERIAEAFGKYSRGDLDKAITQYKKLLRGDNNLGLAQVWRPERLVGSRGSMRTKRRFLLPLPGIPLYGRMVHLLTRHELK
jgi:hypothetical protein